MSGLLVFFLASALWVQANPLSPPGMVYVPGGDYLPLFSGSDADPKTPKSQPSSVTTPPAKVHVDSFFIDRYPVTRGEFLSFIKLNLKWRRDRVNRLFAESNYLKDWKTESDPGSADDMKRPVVNVSWFAAKAYCQMHKKRLPTVDEWEFIASFDDLKKRDQSILEWYAKPTPLKIEPIGSTFMNSKGIWDFYGLIWEWNSDFNSAMVTGESRGDSSLERNLYCGAGSVGSTDPGNYAAFMRFGFRSSLKGNYTIANLGFRCAKSENEP